MDQTVQTTPRNSEIIYKLLPQVTHGLDSTKSPWGLRNNQPNYYYGAA